MYGEDGKQVDLIQYTTKREKGDRCSLEVITIIPLKVPTQRSEGAAIFKRIQFEKDTATRGKQQSYHVVFELLAKWSIGGFIPFVTRCSKRIVVRGRLPVHYNGQGSSLSRMNFYSSFTHNKVLSTKSSGIQPQQHVASTPIPTSTQPSSPSHPIQHPNSPPLHHHKLPPPLLHHRHNPRIAKPLPINPRPLRAANPPSSEHIAVSNPLLGESGDLRC